MKFYQELTLIPDAELSLHFIWSKLYTQLHLALVEKQYQQEQVSIGVSFPGYEQTERGVFLGKKLRLFAEDEATLQQLDLSKWLACLSDYVHYTGIRAVPARASSFAMYQRYQPKSNVERLARRYAKRHDVTIEQALAGYRKYKEERSHLPFICLKSLSTEHHFKLFITKQTVSQLINKGFNTYGLSSISSVPEF